MSKKNNYKIILEWAQNLPIKDIFYSDPYVVLKCDGFVKK
jgi:hypothetical protein